MPFWKARLARDVGPVYGGRVYEKQFTDEGRHSYWLEINGKRPQSRGLKQILRWQQFTNHLVSMSIDPTEKESEDNKKEIRKMAATHTEYLRLMRYARQYRYDARKIGRDVAAEFLQERYLRSIGQQVPCALETSSSKAID